MSDPAPAPAPAPSDPSAIVDQLQTLTDIEGDLAETALAVVEQEQGHAQAQVQEQQQQQQQLDQGESSGSSAEAEKALLDSAEAMESVLEAAIPDAPADKESEQPQSQVEQPSDPTATVAVQDSANLSAPSSSTSPAQEVNQAITAIEADLNNPVLPESVVPAAHDTPTETANEEDTSEIVVDVEEPTMENIAQAALNPENGDEPGLQQQPTVVNGEEAPAPVSTPVPAPVPINGDHIDRTTSHPVSAQPSLLPQGDEAHVPLPGGLTDSSPSVVSNRDLMQKWRADPSNPTLLLSLFNWSVQRTEIADARAWYTALSVDNPTAVQPLLALINLELALSNFQQVEVLFATALKGPSGGITAAADVSVWKAYLHYIRRQNPVIDGAPNVDAVRTTISKAYEFALKECGYDRESGEIWDEYIRFVADTPSKNQWETQAQQDTLRKLYTRAVCIPLNNLEALWKSYDTFESAVNKATSKKFLAERSPAYMTARTALRELRALTDGLPQPILPPTPTFSDADRAAVAGWKAYLKWEEGNPLVIEDDAVLQSRVGYALRKCLAEMRHFPELWYYAATYYLNKEKKEEANSVLQAGVEACPKSFLLTFALTELLEDAHSYAAVHELFVSLIDSFSPEIDALRKTIAREVEIAKGPEIPNSSSLGDVNMDGDGISEIQRMVEERENRGKLVQERRGKEVEELVRGVNVAWVMYMRFARRAEGIKAARGVFGKARKSPHLSWHIFESSAMMEYHSNKDSSVAIRIFELGLKLFSDEVDYVTKYLQFLLNINDDTMIGNGDARALFERSALKIPPSKSRPLWDTWARYEYLYGDLSAVHKLETRFADAFPSDSPLKRFAQRFAFNGIDQVAIRDLGFGARTQPQLQAQAPAPAPAPAPATTLVTGPSGPGAVDAPPQSPGGGGYKRPAPDSPRREQRPLDRERDQGSHHRRGSVDRSPKRYKAHSPPPPPRRYPDREGPSQGQGQGQGHGQRDRQGSGRFSQPPTLPPHVHGRERSPMVPPGRGDRPPYAPAPAGVAGPPVPVGGPSAAGMERDRSGLTRSLSWFIGNLPSTRAFDGPIFRADDIMGLFNNISVAGTGAGAGPGGHAAPLPPLPVPVPVGGGGGRGGYPEPDRRYGGPPMRGSRY